MSEPTDKIIKQIFFATLPYTVPGETIPKNVVCCYGEELGAVMTAAEQQAPRIASGQLKVPGTPGKEIIVQAGYRLGNTFEATKLISAIPIKK